MNDLPRAKEAFEEMREKSSKGIVEASKRVFERKGLGAAVSDIAAGAGVSQGLACRYFPIREAVFHTPLRELVQSGEAHRWSEGPGGVPIERLERFLSETFPMRAEHPEFHRFLFQAPFDGALPVDIRRMVGAQGQAMPRALRRLIIAVQAKEEVSGGDPAQLVQVILACLEGLSIGMTYSSPGEARTPEPEVILRLLGPGQSKERR